MCKQSKLRETEHRQWFIYCYERKSTSICTEQDKEKEGESKRCEFKKQGKKTPHLHSCMHRLLYNQHLELVYIKQMVQSNARRLQLPGKQRDSCSFETRLKKIKTEKASSDELVKQGRKWEGRGDTKESVWSKARAISLFHCLCKPQAESQLNILLLKSLRITAISYFCLKFSNLEGILNITTAN